MWKNLNCILPSKGSQSGKATHCVFLFIGNSGKGKTIEIMNRSKVEKDRGLNMRSTQYLEVLKLLCLHYSDR